MQEIPSPWDVYLRLQTRSIKRRHLLDSYSWGIEEQMNCFLEDLETAAVISARKLDQADAAGARRARSQAKMRKDKASELAPKPYTIDGQLEARETLHLLEAAMLPEQWIFLLNVAEGYSYDDLAKERGLESGTLRVMASRLRNQYEHHYVAA